MKEIMIDIDGVISQWHEHFTEFVNKTCKTNYHLTEILEKVMSKEDWDNYHKWHKEYIDEKNYLTLPLSEFAKEGLLKISEKRNILICTAKEERIMPYTLQWFELNCLSNLPILNKSDKIAVCRERNIREIVEDNVKTLKRAVSEGLVAFGVKRPYNEQKISNTRIIAVNNLLEVEEYL
jgi:uncharacterized HAD superfamily protein